MKALVSLPNTQSAVAVDVYRDGDAVVIVGKSAVVRDTPNGRYRAVGQGMIVCENVAVFEGLRNKAKQVLAKRLLNAPAQYANLVRTFELDRDVAEAEALPDRLRSTVTHVRQSGSPQLPQGSPSVAVAGEAEGRVR